MRLCEDNAEHNQQTCLCRFEERTKVLVSCCRVSFESNGNPSVADHNLAVLKADLDGFNAQNVESDILELGKRIF